jgi:hypothetical protein
VRAGQILELTQIKVGFETHSQVGGAYSRINGLRPFPGGQEGLRRLLRSVGRVR